MRKLTLLAAAALAITGSAFAAPLATNWQLTNADEDFLGTGNTERGGDYNPVTDNVYVVSRVSGVVVKVLDAATGGITVSTELDVTGIPGAPSDTFDLNDVDVADDGVIYGCNLQIGSTQVLRVYRWANEGAAPTTAFAASGFATRYGDSFAVRGSGVNTEIFIGGNGSSDIQVLQTADGVNFTLGTPIATGKATSWGGIAVRTDNTDIILNEPGSTSRQLTLGGSVVADGNGAVEGASFAASDFWINGASQALMVSEVGNVAGDKFGRVFDVTAGLASISTVADTDILGTAANGNAAGVAVFDTARGAVVVLSTNNDIGSFGSAVPVELSVFGTE